MDAIGWMFLADSTDLSDICELQPACLHECGQRPQAAGVMPSESALAQNTTAATVHRMLRPVLALGAETIPDRLYIRQHARLASEH